jgi:hypothetical protein
VNQTDPRALVETIAEKYSLRYVEKDKRFIGLHRGLFIAVWVENGSVCLDFCSPTVLLSGDVVENGKSFSNLATSAIPVDWVQWRYVGGSIDRRGCLFEFDKKRLATITDDDVLDMPETMALDLQSLGAASEAPLCSLCGESQSAQLLYSNYNYEPACQACFDRLKDSVLDGVVKLDVPIQWNKMAMTLMAWTIGFTLAWGLLQQTEDGIDGRLLFAAPFAGSIYFCRAVGKAAQGMNFWLRILTVACILFSIIAGNLWGLRTAWMRQGFDVSWSKTVEVYFKHVLPAADGNAWWFLAGGLAGAWLGLGMLKKQNVVKYT